MSESSRDLLLAACAISAGVHAGLVPQHWAESPALGASFAGATALLAAVAVLARRLHGVAVHAAAAGAFALLLVTYALAATSGLPLLHPEPEPVDALALVTKAVEAAGLLAALRLLRLDLSSPRTKGLLT
jgi:hypothetical protein